MDFLIITVPKLNFLFKILNTSTVSSCMLVIFQDPSSHIWERPIIDPQVVKYAFTLGLGSLCNNCIYWVTAMNYTFYIHYFIQSLKQFHNKYYYPHLTNEEIEGQKSQGACPHFAHRLCHRVGTQAKWLQNSLWYISALSTTIQNKIGKQDEGVKIHTLESIIQVI